MKIKYKDLLDKVNVVGVITKRIELLNATFATNWANYRLKPVTDLSKVDVYELRLDYLADLDFELEEFIKANNDSPNQKSIIVTARDVSEGGQQKDWTHDQRIALYRKYLPYATFVDIEAGTVEKMRDIIDLAKATGVGVIISYHNFLEVPSYAEIIRQAQVCHLFGGDVLKIAVKVETLGDLVELNDGVQCVRNIMYNKFPFKVVSIAIGKPFGNIQCYLDARAGGPFIYGYLFDSVVVGQSRATEIKHILSMLQ